MRAICTGENTAIEKGYSNTTKQQDLKLTAGYDLINPKDRVSTFFVEKCVIHNFPVAPQITSTDSCA